MRKTQKLFLAVVASGAFGVFAAPAWAQPAGVPATGIEAPSSPPPAASAPPAPSAPAHVPPQSLVPATSPADLVPAAGPLPMPSMAPVGTPTPITIEAPVIEPSFAPWPIPVPEGGSLVPATPAPSVAPDPAVAGDAVSGTDQAVRPRVPKQVAGAIPTIEPGPAPGASPPPPDPGPAPPPAQPRPAPVPDAVLQQTPDLSKSSCAPQAIQNGLEGDGAAIVQVLVLNADCTWSSGQALVAYDVRGPPKVDVMVQSAGLSVDVETKVTGRKVSLAMGYVRDDGVFALAVPLAIAPASTTTQTGDNTIVADQDAKTTSGDARSGSQRVRVTVDRDAESVRVLAQNVAPFASAHSGDAVSSNDVVGVAGPQGAGLGSVQTGQAGNNTVAIDQDASSRSGDAVAGSQEVSIHVRGSVRTLGVMANNLAPFAVAVSGDAISSNDAIAIAGPSATSVAGNGQVAQLGDNRAAINQRAVAASGDAIAGAQVIGVVVTGRVDELSIMASNHADGTFAASGLALAVNTAGAVAGPSAGGVLGGASAGQVGNNHIVVGQVAQAHSGDAISGSQVVGVVVGGGVGRASVMPANSSGLNLALSGAAIATNLAGGSAGPSVGGLLAGLIRHDGGNVVDVAQLASMTSGDAISASQIVGMLVHGR